MEAEAFVPEDVTVVVYLVVVVDLVVVDHVVDDWDPTIKKKSNLVLRRICFVNSDEIDSTS